MLLYLEICELHSSLFIQCLRFFVIQNRVFKSVVPPLTLFIEASHSILIVCCMTSMVIKHCFNWKEWVPSDWSMHPHGNLRLPVLVAYTFQTDKVVVSETTKLASFYFTFLLHCFFLTTGPVDKIKWLSGVMLHWISAWIRFLNTAYMLASHSQLDGLWMSILVHAGITVFLLFSLVWNFLACHKAECLCVK